MHSIDGTVVTMLALAEREAPPCNVFTNIQVSFLIFFRIIFFILFHYFALFL